MNSKFEKEAAKLAQLPRNERFEQLIKFPARHEFKVVGRSESIATALENYLTSIGEKNILFVERPSSQGTFTSITFTLSVENGTALDQIYTGLEHLPDVMYVF